MGLFGGGLVATQIGDDTAGGRKFVGIGIAIMIMCCGTAVTKGRKLCCSCGGAHNAHERRADGGGLEDGFSSAILRGPPSPEAFSGRGRSMNSDGRNTDWAGHTPSKRRGSRSKKAAAGAGPGSALARAHLEFEEHGGDSDQQQATEARQRRRRIHFADEAGVSALVNISPVPARSALAVRSPAGSPFKSDGITGGADGGNIFSSADLENQGAAELSLSLSPNAAFRSPRPPPSAAHSVDKDTTLHSALSGLRKMLHDRAEQMDATPASPSPLRSADVSPDMIPMVSDPGARVAVAAANFRHAMSRAAAEADAVSTPAAAGGGGRGADFAAP